MTRLSMDAMTTDLTRAGISHDLRHGLLPAERHTLRWGSHAYHWTRNRGGRLVLTPGHAPGDPTGCPAVGLRDGSTWTDGELLTCVLHNRHATRHAHRPTLGGTVTAWGPTPRSTP